jgi:pimeloyl-ACP methyl ester carboxylesterase
VSGPIVDRASYLGRRLRRRLSREKAGSLAESGPALNLEMDSDSRTLLIVFGGMRGRIGMPRFEFFALTGDIPVKRLFVRDLRQSWYHRGLPGSGSTLMSVAGELRELIAAEQVERMVVAGNSAGGYAALVFGTLLGADEILCFAPQTVLDFDVLATIGDHRWDNHLRPLVNDGALDATWVDLGSALAPVRRTQTHYRVFFDDSVLADRFHAERLLGLEGLRLYRFGRGKHHLVRALRDSGALKQIVRRALQLPGDGG